MWLKFEKNYSDYNKNGLYEDNSGKKQNLEAVTETQAKDKVAWANKL